jgi:para-aminobenzoate synthetase/4-amino-4-deoxychorismate lyase
MELIAELEDAPRGVYCGAVGYLAPPSATDVPRASFNVAIRTVMLDTTSGVAEYGVGGGITYDSSAAAEFDEVLAKARVLTAARPAFRLFETLRHDEAGFRHVDEHLARLGSSAAYFGFRFDPEDALAALESAIADATTAIRVRLSLDRDGAVLAEVAPLPPEPAAPVRIALDDEPVDPEDVWLFHKTTRRTPYGRRRERRSDVDDVVLVNRRGEVTETTIANLAVRLDERWWTPPVASGLLPGIYREVLLREGTLAERAITIETFRGAEAVALVSSVRGWRDAEVVP